MHVCGRTGYMTVFASRHTAPQVAVSSQHATGHAFPCSDGSGPDQLSTCPAYMHAYIHTSCQWYRPDEVCFDIVCAALFSLQLPSACVVGCLWCWFLGVAYSFFSMQHTL